MRKTMKQKIEITGKNIADIFKLPCVFRISKYPDGDIRIEFYANLVKFPRLLARNGDYIIECEDGKFDVELGNYDDNE